MDSLPHFRIRIFVFACCISTTLFLIVRTSLAQNSVEALVPLKFTGNVASSSVVGTTSMDLTSSEGKQLASYLSGKLGQVTSIGLLLETGTATLTGSWAPVPNVTYSWDHSIGSQFGISFQSSTPSYGVIDTIVSGTTFEVDPPGPNLVESGVPPGIPTPPFSASFSFSKPLSVPVGSQLTMEASAESLGYSYMPSVAGSWSFTVSGNCFCSYQPKTFQQYILDALQATYGSGATDEQNASDAYSNYIIPLRNTDAATASTNLALRDAEYLLRGYRGALLTIQNQTQGLSDSLINDLYDSGGPFGLLIYNGLKIIKGSSIAGAGQLPATPPGGAAANLTGWLLGSLGLSIQQVAQTIQAPNYQFAAPKGPSNNSNAPTLPDLQFDVNILQHPEHIEGFYMSVPQAGSASWFDPGIAKAYAWSVYGNRFAALQLSNQFRLDFTNIELSFLNYSVSLDAAGAFDFLNFVAGGVDSFLLIGTPDSNVTGNLSLGLTFVSSGETLVSSVYGDLIVVPEPPSIILIAIGVATIVWCVGGLSNSALNKGVALHLIRGLEASKGRQRVRLCFLSGSKSIDSFFF
jgi:hypothetical protein